jgi:hypothetical protein
MAHEANQMQEERAGSPTPLFDVSIAGWLGFQ